MCRIDVRYRYSSCLVIVLQYKNHPVAITQKWQPMAAMRRKKRMILQSNRQQHRIVMHPKCHHILHSWQPMHPHWSSRSGGSVESRSLWLLQRNGRTSVSPTRHIRPVPSHSIGSPYNLCSCSICYYGFLLRMHVVLGKMEFCFAKTPWLKYIQPLLLKKILLQRLNQTRMLVVDQHWKIAVHLTTLPPAIGWRCWCETTAPRITMVLFEVCKMCEYAMWWSPVQSCLRYDSNLPPWSKTSVLNCRSCSFVQGIRTFVPSDTPDLTKGCLFLLHHAQPIHPFNRWCKRIHPYVKLTYANT